MRAQQEDGTVRVDPVPDVTRYCPLCDERMTARWCAAHRVATLTRRGLLHLSDVPNVGDVLAERFRLDEAIGEGAMGRIFAATDLRANLPVVIKVLRPELARDTSQLARFYLEGTLCASVRHPNVVRVIELAVDDAIELPFIVMDHISGVTLEDHVRDFGPLPEARVAELFAKLARGLAAAHRCGVLHRDLKPSNIMVAPDIDGGIRGCIVDFGLAKLSGQTQPGLTTPGMFLGTPHYMSPEQITEDVQTEAADLYALGGVLHTALTGDRPYHGTDFLQLMMHHVRSPLPQLPAVLRNGRAPSRAMVELHQSLLAKEPTSRPPSADAVFVAFDRIVSANAVANTSMNTSESEAPTTESTAPAEPLEAPLIARVLTSVALIFVLVVIAMTAIQVVPDFVGRPQDAPNLEPNRPRLATPHAKARASRRPKR